ncbi:MAG: hypothetical protein ACLQM8_26380 [Limisphaerales bacterium]
MFNKAKGKTDSQEGGASPVGATRPARLLEFSRPPGVPLYFALCVIRGKNPAVKHEELTGDIMGAAMAVLNELKAGLEVSLLLDFREAKLVWKRVVAGPAHQ